MEPKKTHGLKLERPLAVVSSEWTATDPESSKLLTISVIVLQPDGSADEHHWMFDPNARIDPKASRIHGISEEMVQGKPRFYEAVDGVLATLRGADIGGYNVIADLQVLEKECRRTGRVFGIGNRQIVDAYRLWTVRQPRGLRNAYARFVGAVPEESDTPTAADGSRMTAHVIEKMLENGKPADAHSEAMGWVMDLGGRFARTEDGDVVFRFGPRRGQSVYDNEQFLKWMLGKDFPEDTRRVCIELIEEIHTDQTQEAEDGRETPAVALQ